MKNNSENYLLKVPFYNEKFGWQDEQGNVSIIIENKGIMNRIFQVILKKPKISYVHLDEMGSFIWKYIDGKANLIEIGEELKKHFGDKAEPLYERLSEYLRILEANKFIYFK